MVVPAPQVQRRICPLTTRELVAKVLHFCEEINGLEFYAYQRSMAYGVIESLLTNDGSVITGLFSRQSGKSNALASVALGLCVVLPALAEAFPEDERVQVFRNGVRIGIFAPKQELSGPIYFTIRDRAESELAQAIMNDPEIGVNLTQSRGDSLAFTNGSYVKASTASEQTIVEGATYHLVFIDEAQRVSRAKVSKEIGPTLAATNGTMVKIGTAWMSRGGFHNDIQHNIHVESQGGPRRHYEFDYLQVIAEKRELYNRQKREFESSKRKTPPDRFHLLYEKWVNAEIARLGGTDSEEFKMNFKLLWMESRQIAIKEDVFRELAMPSVEMNMPKRFGHQVAAIDVAKTDDSTVVTILEVDYSSPLLDPGSRVQHDTEQPRIYYRKYILGWLELQGSFEEVQYKAVETFFQSFRIGYCLIDSTGMGDPFCERMQVLLAPYDITVEPFRYSTASKSDMYKFYLQELGARRVFYPAGEDTIRSLEFKKFEEQHLALEREWNGSYLVCAAPEGDHDDYCDSGAMAVWASRHVIEAMPEVDVEDYAALYGRFGGDSRVMWGSAGEKDRSSRYLRRRYQ